MEKDKIFNEGYMPYIIKWGKITTWGAIPFILLPPLMLMLKFGARTTFTNVIAGLVPAVSAMIVWYVVDPVALFPILGVPGLYITYIAGNSKEIRGPAALMSMEAVGVKQGTPEGTIIGTYGIALSVFISVGVLTLGAILGQNLLAMASPKFLEALGYLLPALFGGMLGQNIVDNPKSAIISIPLAIAARYMYLGGLFSKLPSGGGYMQILISVFGTMIIVKMISEKKLKAN